MTFYNRYETLCRQHGYAPNGKPMRDFLGLQSSTISTWKKGSVPRPETLRIISEFFNVSTDYLLGFTDERNSQSRPIASQVETSRREMPGSLEHPSSQEVANDSSPADINTSETNHTADGHTLMDVNTDERILIELFRSMNPSGRLKVLQLALSENSCQNKD